MSLRRDQLAYSVLVTKLEQVDGGICFEPDGCEGRIEVESGSNRDDVPGVTRALRCCVMLSSIVERDNRRKSGVSIRRIRGHSDSNAPLKAL